MPKAINEGSNGFHLYTVVTDGYGNLIAEDHEGKEIAKAKADGDEAQALSALLALTQQTWAKLNADA